MPPTPVSRRERPAKAALTRDGIVAVALRVLREEGLERMTVRRLAAELDTGPASLYVYVQNTAELHAAVLDEMLASLSLPSTRRPREWRDELVELLTVYTGLLLEHASLARSVLTLRPSGPHYLGLVERLLALLDTGGVPLAQAAWGVDVLLQTATATAAEQGTRRQTVEADAEHAALADALRHADPQAYPSIARAGERLLSGTGPQRLRWVFTALIAGFAATPTPDPEPDPQNTTETRVRRPDSQQEMP